MKVLVTGGLGFIGSHLVDRYVEHGHEVVILDNLSTGSLSNLNPHARLVHMSVLDEKMENWLCRERPDIINHHAAQVNVRTSVSKPIFDLESNLVATVRLIQAAGMAGVKKFIFASSGGTVYGEAPKAPIPEDYYGKPVSPYGIHKLASEFYIDMYARQFGFQWVILRYANVYGPRQNPHGESGVISIFLDRLRNGQSQIVYGDGEQVRDYVHVNDVVSANMMFSELDEPSNDVYNVGTGRGTSVNQLIRIFNQLFPNATPVLYKAAKTGDLPCNILSIDKLSALGWCPKYKLEKGLYQLCHVKGDKQ